MRFLNLYHSLWKVSAETLLQKTLVIAQTWKTRNQITDKIWVGGCYSGEDFESLVSDDITCIIKLNSSYNGEEIISHEITPKILNYNILNHKNKIVEISRLNVKTDDEPDYPLWKHFNRCFDYIDNAIENNKSILIHCSCGISRSVSIVILYLMRKRNLSYKDAFSIVKSIRLQADPNPGFVRQLEQLARPNIPLNDRKGLHPSVRETPEQITARFNQKMLDEESY